MSAPLWHFDVLGLPAHADEVAVRRAYALALRRIDQQTEPEAFERLRQAYEAARAWCEQASDATSRHEPARADSSPIVADGASEASVVKAPTLDASVEEAHVEGVSVLEAPSETTPDEMPIADAVPAVPTVPADYTVGLAWRFAADVGARRAETIPAMLDGILAELRTQYIDAPGQFEEHLIDLIGHQRIGHRPEVFAAAEARFHWSEVGHLAALGQRGQWIELVLAQREAWLALAPDRRQDWVDLFVRAEARLDTSLLPRWPEVAKLHERFPAWISLHVSDETLQAWKDAFDAQPASARDVYVKLAPPDNVYLPAHIAAAREKKRQRSTTNILAVFFIAMFVGLVHFVATGMREGFPISLTSPVGQPHPTDTPRQCVELYTQMDKPDAYTGKSDVDIAILKSRAHACAKAGHWHAPPPPPATNPV